MQALTPKQAERAIRTVLEQVTEEQWTEAAEEALRETRSDGSEPLSDAVIDEVVETFVDVRFETFEESDLLTRDRGIVIHAGGAQYQLTIQVRDR